MAIFYGIAFLLSVLLLVAYFFVDKKQEKWLMLLFISIFVCNTGYFLISISPNLTIALLSNSLSYLGSVFLPFSMFMLILKVCNINYHKSLVYTLLGVAVVVLFIATSGGYLPIYYKEVHIEVVHGSTRLVKEYGILHNVYFVYLISYIIAMISVLTYSVIKKKTTSKMHAYFLFAIVFGNVCVWFVEKFIPVDFEFLSISYILNECLLLLLYGMLREYNFAKENSGVDMSVLEFEKKLTEEQVALAFTNWQPLQELTKREKEIVKHMLLGDKRKDIATKLFITDSSVRNHITNIFKKLQVENRAELYNKAYAMIQQS